MNKESFLYVVIFTFLVAFVFVFVIALADNATAAQVAQNQELVSAKAFLNAINRYQDDGAAALDRFESIFGAVEGEQVVEASADGETFLVKQFSGSGVWGTITGVLAVNDTVDRIVGMDIIGHSETPGLGGRIEEEWFKDQFRNERISEGGITVLKGEGRIDTDPDNASVDGVTGASLTSAAMEVIINNEIEVLREAVR